MGTVWYNVNLSVLLCRNLALSRFKHITLGFKICYHTTSMVTTAQGLSVLYAHKLVQRVVAVLAAISLKCHVYTLVCVLEHIRCVDVCMYCCVQV